MSSPQANRQLVHVRNWCAAADADLLERFACGRDEEAFAALLARHGPMVLRLCRRVLGEEHAAQDAFQATFLVLARRASSVRRPESLAAWLYGVAGRIARKARAARRRTRALPVGDEMPADPRPDPLAALSARELLDAVEEEVGRLPEAYRLPVVLCCLEGRTREEAAALLGWTQGSVKGRLERGRALLHERLARRGLSLSAALATAEVARGAGVPALLGAATLRAALAEASLRALPLTRLAVGAVLLLSVGLAAGVAAWPTAAPLGRVVSGGVAPAGSRRAARQEALPPEALARLGSVRFWSGSTVEAVAFSPDRRTLVSGNADGTVRLWEAATGREERVLRVAPGGPAVGAPGAVVAIACSPDGKLLAARAGGMLAHDNSIILWDTRTGQVVRRFGGWKAPFPSSHTGSFTWASRLAFSPDGKTVAAASGDLTGKDSAIRLWDVAWGKEVGRCRGHDGAVRHFAFSGDGKTLASAGKDGTVRLWSPATGQERHCLRGHKGVVSAVAFSSDRKTLVSGGEDRTLRLWNVDGKALRRVAVSEPVLSVVFVGEKTLAWGDDRGTIHLIDARTGQERRSLTGHAFGISDLCLSADGRVLASVGSGLDYAVGLWEVSTGKKLSPPANAHRGPVSSICYSPDGITLASTDWYGTVHYWDPATARERRRFGGKTRDYVGAVTFSPDGKTLAVAEESSTVVVLRDAAAGKELRRLTAPGSGWYTSLAFAPGGKLLLTGGNRARGTREGTPCLWEVATGREVRQFRGHRDNVCSVAFAPDGERFVSGGEDRSVRLWETSTGRELRRLDAHRSHVLAVAFSPTGEVFASTGLETIRLWHADSGRELRRLPIQAAATCLAFSPDGRTLASAGHDQVVRLWEVASGKEVRRWAGHRNVIHAVAFAPDGRSLASAGRDTLVLVWDVTGVRHQGPLPRLPLARQELRGLWDDLAGDDGPRAYQALWRLASAPALAVPFLEEVLRPAPRAEERRIARLIDDLDSDEFTVRERASAELERLGEQAGPRLRKTLEGKPSLEVHHRIERLLRKLKAAARSTEPLRTRRAVAALEQCGTPAAQRLLARLAGGAPQALLTREAKAALGRLGLGIHPARK